MSTKENARMQGGRKSTTQDREELSKAHSINDAVNRPRLTPLFDSTDYYRRVRLDLIPLRTREKAPADRCWQQREYDQVATLERARRGGMNLGVRLPADVVVIDVDPRNFPEGRDPLTDLVDKIGLDLRTAPHVLTGNLEHPGHHYYFRKPASAALLESIEGYEGIELKSFGRQVVAAGSVHPTGGRYEWAPDSPPLHDMPELPAQLVEMARRPERPASTSTGAGEVSPELLAKTLEQGFYPVTA
ncbi:MAG: bifunctional DNA primase/polymerase, partial [Pseudomonadaceae bacterium]